MQVDRRDFSKGVLAAFAAAFSGGVSLPHAFAATMPDESNVFARTALNRLTFGATIESTAAFKAVGYESWLDEQLSLPAMDEALAKRLAEFRLRIEYEDGKDENHHAWKGKKADEPLRYLEAPDAELVDLNDWDKGLDWEERIRPAREVQVVALLRATHARAQLREVMTQFWHDHFNVNSQKDSGTAAYFAAYDRMIRANALGNFRHFLGEVARSPAMGNYLNNADSRASPANENFARELLELHTLGIGNYLNSRFKNWDEVPGAREGRAIGYIDQDVYEVARAFTGWTIGDGREVAEGDKAPRTGTFFYADTWHDPYQKRILGLELRPNSPPLADGERVLDILATHPGTTKFVTGKMIRRLFADEPPPDLHERAANAFLEFAEAPDQIARVVRLIALSEEFRAQAPSKVRRPFEFLAAMLRAAGVDAHPTGDLLWQLQQAGWRQHEWRPPTGHPDRASYWTSTATLSGLSRLSIGAFESWFGVTKTDLAAATPSGITVARELVAYWSSRLFAASPDAAFIEAVATIVGEGNPEAPIAKEADGKAWQIKGILAIASMSPEFLSR